MNCQPRVNLGCIESPDNCCATQSVVNPTHLIEDHLYIPLSFTHPLSVIPSTVKGKAMEMHQDALTLPAPGHRARGDPPPTARPQRLRQQHRVHPDALPTGDRAVLHTYLVRVGQHREPAPHPR